MEKIINPVRQEWAKLLARPKFNNDDLVTICKDVFADVMKEGDEALGKVYFAFRSG